MEKLEEDTEAEMANSRSSGKQLFKWRWILFIATATNTKQHTHFMALIQEIPFSRLIKISLIHCFNYHITELLHLITKS